MKLETKINKIIDGYNNKPKISIIINGVSKEIHLDGGHWAARQEVEDYFTKKGLVSFINNQPESKVIGLTE